MSRTKYALLLAQVEQDEELETLSKDNGFFSHVNTIPWGQLLHDPHCSLGKNARNLVARFSFAVDSTAITERERLKYLAHFHAQIFNLES